MDLLDAVPRLGWVPSRAELIKIASRREVDRALASGRLVRVAQGRYALPGTIVGARVEAARANGVVSHTSAALHWGLAVKEPPGRHMITVPRGRNLSTSRQGRARVFWADLPPADVHREAVTTPLRTVLDCATRLPIEEALVIADAALRSGLVASDELIARAAVAPPQFRARVRRVAAEADSRAQSAFESLVRGYSLDVPGLRLVPQVLVAGYHPDLYDERLRLAIECDSFEFHSARVDLVRDCERYNLFALHGETLIRFAWEHSMSRPDYVRSTLAEAVEVRQLQVLAAEAPLSSAR
jgi:very-short-patch-repair endonuclease